MLQEGLGTKCSPQRHNEFKHHGVVLELVVLIPFPVLVLVLLMWAVRTSPSAATSSLQFVRRLALQASSHLRCVLWFIFQHAVL